MMRAVEDTLEEIGAGDRPRVLVLNKVDAIDTQRREELRHRLRDGVQVSALTGEGLEDLGMTIEQAFARTLEPVELLVPYAEGGRLAELHELAGDLHREDTAEGVRVVARLPAAVAERYERYAVDGDGDGDGRRG
jgi:GTP-binding protein HflX